MGNSTTADVDGTTVTLARLSEIMRATDGSGVVALKALLEHTQRTAVAKVERTTVATRKADLAKALQGQDDERLETVDRIARGLVEEIISNDLTGTGTLTAEEAKDLMQEFLDCREVAEVIDARAKARKVRIFAHLDEVLLAQGVTDAKNHNATLEVPELGWKFCREAAGYKDPSLDEDTLHAMLGDEVWATICDEVPVPAHVEHRLNHEKLLDLANADHDVMIRLAGCLTPGGEKTPKLVPRTI